MNSTAPETKWVDPQSELMITPSEIMEFIYCPRYTYFLNVLKISQYEDRRFKVRKGREVHQERVEQNKNYLRKKIPTIKKETEVYLADSELGVRGIVDEILFLKDCSICPVDYKFTPYKETVFRTHKIQLTLYALLIEKKYHQKVDHGYIAYVRGGSKTCVVDFTEKLKNQAKKMVKDVFDVILREKIPKRTKYKVRCIDCCYKNICV